MKFNVRILDDSECSRSAEFIVEAKDEDEANEIGNECAENGTSPDGKGLDWNYREPYESISVEVETIEIDDDDDDDVEV
jgi:hypothetical protein